MEIPMSWPKRQSVKRSVPFLELVWPLPFGSKLIFQLSLQVVLHVFFRYIRVEMFIR